MNRQFLHSINKNKKFSKNSMLFDGVDEYVNCGNDTSLDFDRLDTFSFSFWFNAASFGVARMFFSKQNSNSPFNGYNCTYLTNKKIRLTLRNTVNTNQIIVDTDNTYDTDKWYHCVVTYDGSSNASGVTVYVNGTSQTLTTISDNLTATITTTNNFQIAGRAGFEWDGYLDDLCIFDKELNSTEVTELYNSGKPNDIRESTVSANIISYWLMGDGDTITTITDQVGTNDGTPTNMESGDITTKTP